MDGFENDEPSQLQPPMRVLRSRVPSVRKEFDLGLGSLPALV